MKKFLLFLGVSLVSLNAYAVEHVIGISGGYSYSSTSAEQSTLYKYPNPNSPENIYTEKTYKEDSNSNGYNLNIEYLINIDSSFTLGLGFTNNNSSLKFKSENLNIRSNDINILFLTKFLTLGKFDFKGGASVGYGEYNIDLNSKFDGVKKHDYFSTKALIDIQYNMTNKVIIFSRAYWEPFQNLNGSLTYNTSLANQDPNKEGESIESNTVKFKKPTSMGINFGIRYKI